MIIREHIDFQRGIDPKQSMDIGLFAKINKITSSDLEFLKIYTNGEGNGHIDLEYFKEIYESSSSLEKYIERVQEVYKLLAPYKYLFGDNFGEDMKKEMKEYVKSYLKNPNYNYAYNCDIMEEGDFDVFFCEIELPSAELLGKKSIKESLDFERGKDPKEVLELGLPAKVKNGLWGLSRERGTGSINIMGNRNESWLEVSDYSADADTFLKNVERNFGDQFFSDIEQRNILKRGGSWQCKFRLMIKPEYRELFKNAFDAEGFIKESINFERGGDPMDTMEIGRVEERKQKMIDEITSEDPSKWTGSSVLGAFIHYRIPRGTQWNLKKFEDSTLKELQYTLAYIQKWNKIDKKFKVFDGPASTVQEALGFERGMDPKYAMDIGKFKSAYMEGRGKCSVIEVKKYKEFTPEELDSLGQWYGSSLSRGNKEKTDPETTWIKIKRDEAATSRGEIEWMDLERFEELKKKGRWMDPQWEKRHGKWYLKKSIRENMKFERGQDPKNFMKIGYIRPVNQLKKDYDWIQELVQSHGYLEFQTPFRNEAMDLIEDNKHFGWGNIHYNFKNMSREQLYPFEQLVQKYTKLLGLNEPQR